MTRYFGVDHSSTTLAEAAAWCRNNAIEERDDYDYDYRRRPRATRCTCNSLSESPCDYCSDDSWCWECDNDTDECVCGEEEDDEEE